MVQAIESMVAEVVKDTLQTACIDDVPGGDETRAGLVKIGRYLDDVSIQRIVIQVHENHLLGEESRQDRRSTQAALQDDGYRWNLPAETAGGSIFRWHRATVQIAYHLNSKTREEGNAIAHVVMGRVRQALRSCSLVVGMEDDFGVTAHTVEITNVYVLTNEAERPATGRAFVDYRYLLSETRT